MRNIVWRLILALGAGLIVTGLCLDLTGIGLGARYVTNSQERTRLRLKKLEISAEAYRLAKARWPASIADFYSDWSDMPRSNRTILDDWQHPII